ncbi:hypothetical protein F3Y22_tig00111238pilonHSYRG00276 [Hibiscus syriacus]|uniref:Reverse transcriptase domain-containing protein n=1 Tax=Hibiscus syriacus TaxID=106335 RepID=A0A6A2YTF9_HIBSY|nr:hypothetical protein F3Y22_tig00111238pilonHSYRG00276 [Hibiscus syriacus]
MTTVRRPRHRGSSDYFRFDACWTADEGCRSRVKQAWEGSPGSTLAKIQSVGDSFHQWQFERRDANKTKIASTRACLDHLLSRPLSNAEMLEVTTLKAELHHCSSIEEAYWHQRSRNNWLQHGNRNTPYFHDVYTTFFQIHPTKAQGVDGLPASFYRSFWPIFGEDVTALCLGLLSGQNSMESVNQTVLVLLPKVTDSVRFPHFRPIAFCRVIFKIVSKCIVNRLKPLLPSCIDETQAAFVPGRQGSDNMIIAHEVFHHLKSSTAMLVRLGFDPAWVAVALVMSCVTTVSYSIRINGSLTEFFQSSRGLRQGDPLSPFLFVICTQGLSLLLHHKKLVAHIQGVKISHQGPSITHLLFVDDCLLFIRNYNDEVLALRGDGRKNLVSYGGREIYIKSVGQAMPHMQWDAIFYLPALSMTSPGVGGVGFRDLHAFNLALLGKQIWRLVKSPDSLIGCILAGKYFPGGSLWSAPLVDSAVCMFQDSWASPVSFSTGYIDNADAPVRCGEFMIPGMALLNEQLVRQVFLSSDADAILRCSIVVLHRDLLVWGYHSSGLYSVRSGYTWLMRPPQDIDTTSSLWLFLSWSPTLPKIRIFGWRLAADALPVGSRLVMAGLSDGVCPMCRLHPETALHAIRDCPDSTAILSAAGFPTSCIHTSHISCGRLTPGWHLISEARALQDQCGWAFSPRGVLAVGVIARDEKGIVVGLALGANRILVESDAANLIRQLQRRILDLSVACFNLEEALRLLAANPNLNIAYCRRSANLAAHTLATWASHSHSSIYFDDICPDFINSIVSSDIVTFGLVLYVIEEILEGLDLTRESKATVVIISEFLPGFFQQNLEKRVAEVAGGDDEPSKLSPYIHGQISFGNIRRRFRAVAAFVVGIVMDYICLDFAD